MEKRKKSIKYKTGFSLVFVLFINIGCFAQEYFYRINLVGYTNALPKRALLLAKADVTDNFFIQLASGGTRVMLRLEKTKETPWPPFSFCYALDFSKINTEGDYLITNSTNEQKSPIFHIGEYPTIQEDVIHFMQSQRCGYNPYIDRVCHPLDGRSFYGKMPESSYIDATGGCHDAGDQLKYLITGSNATARMMIAYEWNKEGFVDSYNAIGQKDSNGIPDILDEAKWGLDWIHKLHVSPDQLIHQVADDRDHLGFKMPDEDPANYGWGANKYRPAYFATGKPQGVGKYQSEATGVSNVAGRSAVAMAMGFRIWKNDLKNELFAAQCIKDAIELYEMGKAKEGFQQGNSYGAPYRYNERTWADDMEWAAAELYKATQEKKYLKDAIHYANIIQSTSWMEMDSASHYEMYPYVNVGHYALWQVGDASIKKQMAAYYKQNLLRIEAKAAQNIYGVGHLFIWCSNNLAAAVSTQAILYEKMTGDQHFSKLMQDHVNWLFGVNPWGTSMITGVPEKGDYPMDVHMPFWILNKKMIKGSLVDGPLLSSIHDRMLAIRLNEPDEYAGFQPDHIKYWDDWADYSTNEPTMDGSADLFLILTHLSKKAK